MSASPSQGYNVPVKVELGTTINTKLAPETVIGEKINFSVNENQKIFSPDLTPTGLQPGEQHDFSILICLNDGEAHLEVTFNGTDWCEMNSGEGLDDDVLFLFTLPVKEGDLFNLRLDDDRTIRILRIGERQC